MCFFLYYLEELCNRSSDDNDGATVAAFLNTKAIFIDTIYWNRAGAYSVEPALPQNLIESI